MPASQRHEVHLIEGHRLLLALIGLALADTALLVAVLEIDALRPAQGDDAGWLRLFAAFMAVLIGGGVWLFRAQSPLCVLVVDDDGLQQIRPGLPARKLAWRAIQRVRWLQQGAGDVLQIQLGDGSTVQWSHSSWRRGHAAFQACAAEVERRMATASSS